MYGVTIINVISWLCDNIALMISLITAIGALWKFRKQQALAITLQERQENAQKELETYKNELERQNEKIKHLNKIKMANLYIICSKKE